MIRALRKFLPRATRAMADARLLEETLRDVLDYLRALPELQVRTFTLQCSFPFEIATDVANPAVVVINGYQTRDPAASVTLGLPQWQRSESGVRVSAMTGLTTGTDYTITALIVGS